jgi:hypothetical protein
MARAPPACRSHVGRGRKARSAGQKPSGASRALDSGVMTALRASLKAFAAVRWPSAKS